MDSSTANNAAQQAQERDAALMFARRARKKIPDFVAEEELSLVPYLDIMMNLVIFMLVTIASFMPLGILSIFPPAVSKDTGASAGPQAEITLTVAISDSGFIIAGSGAVLPPITKKANGDYDYAGLTQKAVEIKTTYPNERTVVIVADENIRYEVLVKTMDALRMNAKQLLFDDVKLSAAAG